VPPDHHGITTAGSRRHAVDADLSRCRLGDVENCLAHCDVAGRHGEMDRLFGHDPEFLYQIDTGPADYLAVRALDHGPEQLSRPVVEQPEPLDRSARHVRMIRLRGRVETNITSVEVR